MEKTSSGFQSSALQANLERTRAAVEIPDEFSPLLAAADSHFGLSRRTRELLTELNHPFVNWSYVLRELRGLSLGHFYEFSGHPRGLEALTILGDIYFRVILSRVDEDVRATAVRYLFDFINTVVTGSCESLGRNNVFVGALLNRLADESKSNPLLFRKSSGFVRPLLEVIAEGRVAADGRVLAAFLETVFDATYAYWLTQPDPASFAFTALQDAASKAVVAELVGPLSHRQMRDFQGKLRSFDGAGMAPAELIKVYAGMPDYSRIAEAYLIVADELERRIPEEGHKHLAKLDFLFNMMAIPGLAEVHAATLREINRSLKMVFREEKGTDLQDFLRRIFELLGRIRREREHSSAILDCIGTIAKEVFSLNDHPLVDILIDAMIATGFHQPDVKGTTTDWQVDVNPLHIRNIRLWLEVIAMKPRWTKKLVSALIVNLKLGGVFVRDTDLLQKDIAAFLAADIAPAYNAVKQLLRIFPVYFREIGAEGELREISTRVDELTFRKDRLVNFLRKQSHVESNSLLVGFVEDMFRFWESGDKEWLRGHVPQEIYEEVPNEGEFFDGLHAVFQWLIRRASGQISQFLTWDRTRTIKEIQGVRGATDRDKDRAQLMIRFYQLLNKKYSSQHADIIGDLEGAAIFSSSRIRALRRRLLQKDYRKSLSIILDFLQALKGRVLAPGKTEPLENIYHKRHIAAGIPSMYGTFSEQRFDAVGLIFRLESLATALFEELVRSLNLKFITKSTLIRIHDCLWLYVHALELEGIATEGLVAKMKYLTSALQIRQFSVDQYIDIFQFMSKSIQGIIRDYYIDLHRSTIPVVVGQITAKPLSALPSGDSADAERALYQHSENLFRSLISSAFGLQVLDTLINGIIRTLSEELERFKENKNILNLVMAYDQEQTISTIHVPNNRTDNQILVGNKGYFLKQLASMGFPVPHGFIITTEVFRGYDAVIAYKYIFKDLSARIYKELLRLEKATGKKFDDASNPLLLSVRSGATISLPGMMQSFLNVGLNEAIAEGLSRKEGYEWAAWDCYRRFLQTWGMFQGLDRDFFDSIIDGFKSQHGVTRKMEFAADEMRAIAMAYKEGMENRGVEVPDDPYQQLEEAILKVFASWYSEQAEIYRHQMHLSDEWGTAVIVQEMVYGNLNDSSGSGVIFTRNPRAMAPGVNLYGDFIFGVQGDDIVSGLVATYPISEQQRRAERPDSPISLETKFPDVFAELKRLAEFLIYEKGLNHQEIEFTFERPGKDGLYVLQTREMVQSQMTRRRVFRESPELQRAFLGRGIGVSGGALSGRAVYSDEDIDAFRRSEPDTPLILIRPDTVPDDVGILLKVEGLLTARGGGTSHAAVTIPQLNKVGVVGFNKLTVYETKGYSTVGDLVIAAGDFIAVDGWTGSVYAGRQPCEIDGGHTITL